MDPIRYVVYRSHLSPETTDAEARAYVERLGALLRGQFPAGATVELRERVSGVGGGLQGDHDPEVQDQVARLAERAWSSCSVPGCPRTVYADDLCEPHYRRARRGSRSDAPVRTRGTEPLRPLSLRLPESVHAALGDEPGAQARQIIEAWAKRRRAARPRPPREPSP